MDTLPRFLCDLSERADWTARFEARVALRRPDVSPTRAIGAAALQFALRRTWDPELAADAYMAGLSPARAAPAEDLGVRPGGSPAADAGPARAA